MDDKFGLVIHVSAEAPPGPARSPKVGTRYFHWKEGKRLPHGGLVALVTKGIYDQKQPHVAVAVLTMSEYQVYGLRLIPSATVLQAHPS